MNKQEFIALLERIAEGTTDVHEQVEMTDVGFVPLRDEYGDPIVRDVIISGDGRLYVERADDESESEQDIITLLYELDNFLPAIIDALRNAPEGRQP